MKKNSEISTSGASNDCASQNDIEKMLLSGISLDELIKQKMNDEISLEILASKAPQSLGVVTDFDMVPITQIFSLQAVYKVFNRKTRAESFLNGIQAEGLIGLNSSIRRKLTHRETDCFLIDDYFVKFYSFKTA